MTTDHSPKISVLTGPLRSVVECSCGNFEHVEPGSGRDVDERLLFLHRQHAEGQE